MLKVAVLCSGGGTNLQVLIDAEKAGNLGDATISLVIASRPGIYALERAKAANIPTVLLRKPKNAALNALGDYEYKLLQILDEYDIGLVVLAGFFTVIGKSYFALFKDKTINVHAALLPSFGGKGFYGLHVHKAVLEAGVKITGATVHFVDEEIDHGPIILQKAVEALDDDTPEILQKRVMEAEWQILPEAVRLFAAGRLKIVDKKVKVI